MFNGLVVYRVSRYFKSFSKSIDFIVQPPDKTGDFIIDYGLMIKIREGNDKTNFYLNADETNRLINVLKQFTEQSEKTINTIRRCQTCKWLEKRKEKGVFFK